MENWKQTVGEYQVSDKGRVRNGRGRVLKTFITEGSYEKLKLVTEPTVQKTFAVARLVAEAFIPNKDNKPQVDHINRDSFDNRVENLRWATIKENAENKGISLLHIKKIRNLIKSGCTNEDIYKIMG